VLKPSAIPSIFPKSLQERRNERDSLIETDDVNDAYLCNECCFTSNIFQEFAQHIFTHDESEGETTEELEYEKDSSVAAKNLSNMPETLTAKENLPYSTTDKFKCSHCEYRAQHQICVEQHILSQCEIDSEHKNAKWIPVSGLITESVEEDAEEEEKGLADQLPTDLPHEPLSKVFGDGNMENNAEQSASTGTVVEDTPITQMDIPFTDQDPLSDVIDIIDIELGNQTHEIFLVDLPEQGNKHLTGLVDQEWKLERMDDENILNSHHSTDPESSVELNKDGLSQEEIDCKIELLKLDFCIKQNRDSSNRLHRDLQQALQTRDHLQLSANALKTTLESTNEKYKLCLDELDTLGGEKEIASSQLSKHLSLKRRTEISIGTQRCELVNLLLSLHYTDSDKEKQENLLKNVEESLKDSEKIVRGLDIEIECLQRTNDTLSQNIAKAVKSREDLSQSLESLWIESNGINAIIRARENPNVIRSKIEALKICLESHVRSYFKLKKNLLKTNYFNMFNQLSKRENHVRTTLNLEGVVTPEEVSENRVSLLPQSNSV